MNILIKKFMKVFTFVVITFLFSCTSEKNERRTHIKTSFEISKGTETATYAETIAFYQQLADNYTAIKIYEMDKTDSGEPLHMVTYNPDRSFESEFSGERNKNIVLINNGIHPRESDGIDASMLLLRDFAEGKIEAPKNTIIAIIPVYNIGGALNRNSTTRTNQNGPKEYGFRGNSRNYDLNRDFIKADTKNARAFIKLFQTVKPDLFIDNHVSNGADYQYTLTHLFTQHNKLSGPLGDYINTSFMPQLEDSLQVKKWDITPYVNVYNTTPDNGFTQFMDLPRYSTGYTTLFNTLGMMVETHMLKPYQQRVKGTYELMRSFIDIADKDASVIKELRKNSLSAFKVGTPYTIQWKTDSTRTTTLQFKGYEGEKVLSPLTGSPRLQYDTTKPFTREVTYYNYMKPLKSVKIPAKYIIPKGYWNVIELLKLNKIKYETASRDTVITAEVYRIKEYETSRNAYEGHYVHYNTETETTTEQVHVKNGDFIIETQQNGIRYLLETLEPSAPDSFFNWNFFDPILQQKEGFSAYVWEDMAIQFLEANPKIKKEFEAKKLENRDFADNWYAQLDWIHKKSPYYESAHLRYPVVRVGG